MIAFRGIVLALALVEAAVWGTIFAMGAIGGISSEAKSFNRDIALLATIGFFMTCGPALILAFINKWLPVAAVLAGIPVIALLVQMIAVL